MAAIRHGPDRWKATLVLEAIGLDDEHTAVYRLLLSTPSADVDEIARRRVDAGADRVQAVVDDLERLGLLARQASAPDRVVASPPSLALRPMLLERERRLTEAHEALVRAQRALPPGRRAARGARRGRRRARPRRGARSGSGSCRPRPMRRVDVFVLREVALVDGSENTEEDRALARGVRYRVVVEAPVLERPGFLDQARVGDAARRGDPRAARACRRGCSSPTASSPCCRCTRTATQKISGALLVHPSGLLDLVNAMFEESWRAATRLVEDAAGSRADDDAVDRELLKLLLLGLTDAAAGAQLGISVRTVQRRVAELMETAGVTTRIQLGAEAVRRAWI